MSDEEVIAECLALAARAAAETLAAVRDERWLPIPGYEGRYDVSDAGRVRSWLAWQGRPVPRLLTPTSDASGYLGVKLDGRKGRTSRVHRVVCEAFMGPRPEGFVTRHLNGDRHDNRLANLAYGTNSENMLDSVRHGTHRQAGTTHCPKGHPYSEGNTYTGRRGNGETFRACRTCRNAFKRAARARGAA